MGRNFPPDYYHHQHYATHPLLSLSLFLLSIATTVSFVTALCGFLNRKEENPEVGVEKDGNNNDDKGGEGGETLTSPPANNEAKDEAAEQDDDPTKQQPLPPPPSMRSASYHIRSSSATLGPPPPKTKLGSSMSMRVPGQALRQASKKDDGSSGGKRDHKKLKHEDSIWKKTIILGEKCKISRDEEEDGIAYDEEGNRISTYHPKTSSNLPMSRQSSEIDDHALPR